MMNSKDKNHQMKRMKIMIMKMIMIVMTVVKLMVYLQKL